MRLPQDPKIRRSLFIGALLLVTGAVWLVFWLLSFRLVSVSPNNKVSSVITQITFTFSKKLSNETITGASVSPATNGTFIVDNNQLIFKPTDDLKEGKLTFSLKNIKSENGDTIKQINKGLTVGYVAYNTLSDAEKQRQVTKSSGGQDRFTLLNGFLPHAAYNYTLDYIEPLSEDKTLALTVDVYGKDSSESDAAFIARMEQAYKDVLDYIESHKGKNSLSDYVIFYNSDYLSRYNTIPNENTDGG